MEEAVKTDRVISMNSFNTQAKTEYRSWFIFVLPYVYNNNKSFSFFNV